MEQKKSTKTKKVGVNTSSGAKKVQRIEKEKVTTPKKESNTSVKKTVTKQVAQENVKADARLQAAKARLERKERRKAAREKRLQAFKEKQLAAREREAERRLQDKERAKERRAARMARREMLKNETKTQRAERKEREKQERIALRKQNAELRHELALKRKEERMQRRQLIAAERKNKENQKTRRREKRAPGIGGWLAAVISLGVASLAMLTVITVGGINMNNMSVAMGDGYRNNLYEMTELSENLDANLNKLRVATGVMEQRKLLTDILVQSELMEGALERFPVDMATTSNVTSFVNRTSAYAREKLNAVSSGRTLSEKDEETLEYIYQTNAAILQELHNLRDTMTEKDWMKLVKDAKAGMMKDGFQKVNDNMTETPSSFTENKKKVTAKGLSNAEEITSAQAIELAKEYFKDYGVEEVSHKGEAVADGLTCFNLTLTDGANREIYAQISKAGGKLIMFDSYEKCDDHNFSQEQCVEIAQNFLTSLGMKNMKAVWLQENGTAANIKFVYEQDGVLCYSDMVVVKVCETKGMPVGFEALPYYLNHGKRNIESPAVTQSQAMQALGRLEPATVRLALIPYEGEEVLTYEFTGSYQDNEYFAYISAETGEELEMFTVMNTKQGRLLR